MIAQEHHLALHDQIDALAGIRAVADNIAQAINLADLVVVDIGQDGLECFQIAVDIADQSFHG